MEAYEARPKDSGSYAGIVVLMQAFGLDEASAKDACEKAKHFSPNI
jgi:dienelactone hydrolase